MLKFPIGFIINNTSSEQGQMFRMYTPHLNIHQFVTIYLSLFTNKNFISWYFQSITQNKAKALIIQNNPIGMWTDEILINSNKQHLALYLIHTISNLKPITDKIIRILKFMSPFTRIIERIFFILTNMSTTYFDSSNENQMVWNNRIEQFNEFIF